MRACKMMLALGVVMALVGCDVLPKSAPRHFFVGSVGERTLSISLDQALENLEVVLEQKGLTRISKTHEGDKATVRASGNGRVYMFDLQQQNQSTRVRLEMDQAGNQSEIANLLNFLESFSMKT